MKKLLLSFVATSLAATSFAHGGGMDQGNILLYGLGTYSSQGGTTTEQFGNANSHTTDNDKIHSWKISLGVGYNITDNITVGLDGFYGNSKQTIDKDHLYFNGEPPIDQYKSFDWGLGPFARYSLPLSQYFFAYGQVGAHYLNGRQTYRYVTAQTGGNSFVADDNYNGFDVSFVPAVGAMLTKTLGLTFSIGGIGYEYRKYELSPNNPTYTPPTVGDNFTAKTNDFNISFGQQFNIGIQKYFGCSRLRHGHHAEPMDDTRRMDMSDEDDHKNSHKNHKHDDE